MTVKGSRLDATPLQVEFSPDRLDASALAIAKIYDNSQSNLMTAFALREGDDQEAKAARKELAKKLGLPSSLKEDQLTVDALQSIAKERFERSSSIMTLFSNVLDKISQMRDSIIRNIGR
jgi:hypothetical protein